MDIYLLHYNNYYNRILKRLETTQEYLDADAGYQKQALVSFNLNDGIMTSQVVNFDAESFDYAIVTENSTEDPETHISIPGVLISRWFIMQANRNRTGQWTLQLQRDLVADHYNELKEAPVFVEKATIQSDTDVAIYNNENCNFNQIKKDEILLQDLSQTPWLVGYYAKNSSEVQVEVPATELAYTEYPSQSAWPFNKYTSEPFHIINKYTFTVRVNEGSTDSFWTFYSDHDTTSRDTQFLRYWKGRFVLDRGHLPSGTDKYRDTAEAFIRRVKNSESELLSTFLSYYTSYDTQNKIASLDGTYIKFTNDPKYYKIKVKWLNNGEQKLEQITPPYFASIAAQLSNIFNDFKYETASYTTKYTTDSDERSNITANFTTKQLMLELEEADISSYKIRLTANSGSLSDSPYCMFAMPYDTTHYIYTSGEELVEKTTPSRKINKHIADAIALQLSTQLYDIQLLPYCPLQNIVADTSEIDLHNLEAGYDYDFIKNAAETEIKGFILYPHISKFNFDIIKSLNTDRQQGEIRTYNNMWQVIKNIHWICNTQEYTALGTVEINDNIEIVDIASVISRTSGLEYSGEWQQEGNKLTLYATYTGSRPEIIEDVVILGSIYTITYDNINSLIVDKKIDVNCTNYRLNAPNGSASFDFNLTKNGGAVNKFNIDCYYKPYSPYIHVNPDFKGLYGRDYNDYRGLICQGDFSIPIINSEWKNYEINNKNYLNTFNREIQSLELKNNVSRLGDAISTITGTVSGATSGAQKGFKMGGAAGAVAGAAGGSYLGLAGGLIDYEINEAIRADQMSLQYDRFNFNLQNIQARPYTLAKTTAFDANNKLWPYIEKYTCTEQEKNIFKDEMTYEGMTVSRIDKINNFLSEDYTYIRCQLIRSTDIKCDDAQLRHIGRELKQGLYMKG